MYDELKLIRKENGEPKEIIGYWIDITDKKRSEEDLRLSNERFMLASRATRDALWEWNGASGELWWSEAYYAILGYSPELVTPGIEVWLARVHPEDRERVRTSFIWALGSTTDQWMEEYRIQSESGDVAFVMDRATITRDQMQTANRVTGAATNITKTRETQLALLASERLYRGMFATNPHPMWVYDLNTLSFLDVNNAAIAHYGYSREEFLSMTIMDIRPSKDVPKLLENVDRIRSGRSTSPIDHAGPWGHRRKDGSIIDVEITSHILTFDGREAELVLVSDITNRKRAERQLEKFRQAIERSGDVIFMTDLDGTILYANPSFEAIYGYTEEEWRGKTPRILKSGMQSPEEYTEIWRLLLGNQSILRQMINKTKDGRLVTVEASLNPVVDEKGDLVGFLAIQRDVTARIQEQKHVRLLSLALENVMDAVTITDEQNRIKYVNKSFEKMYGYSNEELIGRVVDDLRTTERKNQQFAKILPKTQKEGWQGELWNKRKDGTEFPIWLTASPVRDEEGRTIALIGVARDVTEKKLAEEALRSTTEQLEQFFKANLDLLCIADTDGSFHRLNPEWEHTLGYTLDELEGKKFLDFVHPEDLDSTIAAISELAAQKEILNFVNRYRRKDGEYRWIEWRSVPAGGMIYAAARDITARKLTEEANKRSADEIRKALSLLDATLQSTADGILVVDTEGKISGLNQRFLEMWQIPNEVIASRDDKKAISFVLDQLSDPQQFLAKVQALYANPVAESFDTLEFKDGRIFERYSKSQIIDGKVVGRVWSFREVTERKRSQEALENSEQKYRQVVENAAEVIYLTDTKGNFTYANDAALRITEYSIADLVGKNYFDLIIPEHRNRAALTYYRQFLGKIPSTYLEFSFKTKTGKTRWFGQNGTLVLVDDKPIGFHFIARDITERKHAEEALRESEERYRTVANSANDAIITSDDAGNIVDWNRGAQKMFGYTEAEISGQPLTLLVPPKYGKRHLEGFQRVQAGGEQHLTGKNVELEGRRKDGSEFPLELSLSKWEATSGQFYTGIIRDITDRRLTEDALRESQRMINSLVNNLSGVVYRCANDPNWTMEYMSEVVEALTGYPASDFIGNRVRSYNSLIDSRDRESVWDEVQRALKEQRPYILEYRIRTASGEERWVWERGRGVYDHERLVALEGFITDMTDRKHVEVELKHSQEWLKAIFEASRDGIVMEEDQRIVFANKAFARMYGYNDPEEIIGRSVSIVQAPEDNERMMEYGRRRLQGEPVPANYEFIGLTKDGRRIPLEASVSTVSRQGKTNIMSVIRDIAERKQAERALLESETRYRKFFEEDLTGDFISTVDGKILDCNPAFARMFGFTSVAEVLSTNATAFYASSAVREKFLEQLRKEKKLEMLEETMRRNDGTEIHIVENVTGIFDEHGNLTGLQGYVFDDTKRKQTEQQLFQMQKMESIGNLAGGIAHDFNNILGILLGHITLLESPRRSPEQHAASAEAIHKAIKRGAGLVRQILTFARKTDPQLESLSVNAIVEEFLTLSKQTFPKTINLETHLDPKLPLIVADHTQVHQALLNLAVNARDVMPEGGTLTITTSTVKGEELKKKFDNGHAHEYVHIVVKDTGVGMDENTLNRIFEPFFTTKEKGKGTGLGLAVVYGVVTAHRGFVDVESTPGLGTTFHLYFPVDTVPPTQVVQSVVPEQASLGGTETILVVEDEDMLRDMAVRLLEQSGYTVLTAATGPEAISKHNSHSGKIDLVFTDFGLPGFSGIEVMKQIRKRNPQVRTVFTSGYISPKIRSEMIQMEVHQWISKPYKPAAVLKAIREVLDSTKI